MKESFGDLEKLEELGKNKKYNFTTEQLLDKKLKNIGGENRLEVSSRMEQALKEIIDNESGNKIAIVSHGASIKFLLMKWCKINPHNELEYDNRVLKISSPSALKLVFKNKELIDLKQII